MNRPSQAQANCIWKETIGIGWGMNPEGFEKMRLVHPLLDAAPMVDALDSNYIRLSRPMKRENALCGVDVLDPQEILQAPNHLP